MSLFSGAGGLDLGFEAEGFHTVLAIDSSPAACASYALNRPFSSVKVLEQNLSTFLPEQLAQRLEQSFRPRGVIGGPPCQSFSIGNVYKHPEDIRSQLPVNYAKILKLLNADGGLDFFLFENVTGIRSQRHKEQYEFFKELFTGAGFRLSEAELDAADYGVPQHRRRVFVVGFNSKRYGKAEFDFPKANRRSVRTVRQAIGDLPEPLLFEKGLTPERIRMEAGHANHWAMQPESAKFANVNGELRPGDRRGRAFRVLEWDRPSPTVAYGHREVHVHPDMKRRLSVYEAMLLQGFPTDYELAGTLSDQIRLVSDAVPPPLAAALARAVRTRLDS